MQKLKNVGLKKSECTKYWLELQCQMLELKQTTAHSIGVIWSAANSAQILIFWNQILSWKSGSHLQSIYHSKWNFKCLGEVRFFLQSRCCLFASIMRLRLQSYWASSYRIYQMHPEVSSISLQKNRLYSVFEVFCWSNILWIVICMDSKHMLPLRLPRSTIADISNRSVMPPPA